MREQPEQQPPPVQRLRMRYAKRGRLRFTSHRDFSRAFERAVFRARIPMAYSSGFNPHPRISYAGAAPTGSASEAEYLEIALAEVVDPARVHADSTPRCRTASTSSRSCRAPGGSLADRLEASLVATDARRAHRLSRPRDAVDALLATDEVIGRADDQEGAAPLRRPRGDRLRRRRPPDPAIGPRPRTCAILDVVLRHGSPSVRPDDVLAALHQASGLRVTAALQQRLAQGPSGRRRRHGG